MNLYKRNNTANHVCLVFIGGKLLLSLFELIYKFVNEFLF